jgi:chlorobactene lauroyltransferase
VRWASETDPRDWDHAVPTLFVANHTNWWDGFFAFLLAQELGQRFHILMEATNLERYRAFRLIGVLPMRRDVARHAYADLASAAGVFGPGTGLWIFPQGSRRPAGERPTGCERGAAQLVRTAPGPLRICPVAFRYPFLGEQLPEAFALVGRPWVGAPVAELDRRALMGGIERGLGETLDILDGLLAAEDLARFRVLIKGKLSVNKRMDRFRHRVGLLGGTFEARNG